MMKKQIEVAYKPKVKANDDTSNFDNTFTNEPVVDPMVAGSALSQVYSPLSTRLYLCVCADDGGWRFLWRIHVSTAWWPSLNFVSRCWTPAAQFR